ncbi:hypothetical protein [Streptomyces sp. Isolate_45]|uniref:hypothetical protein n=1 Tax=Streptomyces sp. Isolate_45 TaxID=2950111 RepID=UPI002481FA9C|nr:hypothetical protein [Streptomyces sp. Isolate_45]MDA5282195.1 hypothetical protein [Streptomyces sp. Isolate_45]
MGYDGMTDVRRESARAQWWAERLTIAVASVLSFALLAGAAVVFGSTAWRLATETGATAFSRFLVPVVLVSLVVLPLVPARAVFRAGLRKGRERRAAAVPAVLTLLGASVVPFAALCLIVVYAD